MNRIWIVTLAIILAAAPRLAVAQASGEADRLMKAAQNAEVVDGDLKAAIAQYAAIAKKYERSDRATTAQALIHMADCYQKQGDAEAKKIYERVVREFGDQKAEASTARVRLTAMVGPTPNGSPSYRKIWSYGDPAGTISSDGRYLSYPHWETGNLGLHDFVTGRDHVLTNKGAAVYDVGFCEFTAISKDGKSVAYAWYVNDHGRYELRILDSAGTKEPRTLYDNKDVSWLAPFDWSKDGKWVAVQLHRNDQTTQLGLVSTVDGSLKVLKSVDWDGTTAMWFSPDGKHLAYDLPGKDPARRRNVFVMATDGSMETRVGTSSSNDFAAGWSPDGNSLLFFSDRAGSIGLWSVPMASGKPTGEPLVVRHNIGTGTSLGITSFGTLYFGARAGDMDVQTATFDLMTGQVQSTPMKPINEFVGRNSRPAWSRDGRLLAFSSSRGIRSDGKVIGILDTKTTKLRVVRPDLAEFQWPFWSPDSRTFALTGTDRKGRRGVFLVDAETGVARSLALSSAQGIDGYFSTLGWSADGRKVYYAKFLLEGRFAPVEHDIETGQARELLPMGLGNPTLSPNGEYIAARSINDGKGNQHSSDSGRQKVVLISTKDGGVREIYTADGRLRLVAWAPDSQSIFVVDAGKSRRIRIADGKAQDLNYNILKYRHLEIHPDGKQIAYTTGSLQFELWALENFLPTQTASNK
jgi:Tol biopolymer transport system component